MDMDEIIGIQDYYRKLEELQLTFTFRSEDDGVSKTPTGWSLTTTDDVPDRVVSRLKEIIEPHIDQFLSYVIGDIQCVCIGYDLDTGKVRGLPEKNEDDTDNELEKLREHTEMRADEVMEKLRERIQQQDIKEAVDKIIEENPEEGAA